MSDYNILSVSNVVGLNTMLPLAVNPDADDIKFCNRQDFIIQIEPSSNTQCEFFLANFLAIFCRLFLAIANRQSHW